MIKEKNVLSFFLVLALLINIGRSTTSMDVLTEVNSNQRILSATPSFDTVVFTSKVISILGMTKDLYSGGNNTIYAIDTEADQILKFDDQFNLIHSWGEPGSGDGQFLSASSVAVDKDHNVYVVELSNGRRIQKFDSDGNHLLSFGTSDGLAWVLSSVKVGCDGNIFVTSTSNEHIFKFKTDGSFISKHDLGYIIMDLAFDSDGNIHVVVFDDEAIKKYDSDFNLLLSYGANMTKPDFITIDCNDNLYVTDEGRVTIWTKEGKPNDTPFFGSKGNGIGQFEGFLSIIVDGPYAYVSDVDNANVQKFNLNNYCILVPESMGLNCPIHVNERGSETSSSSVSSIVDIYDYNISDPICSGSISSLFEESLTCNVTKPAGKKVSLHFLSGNCKGDLIGETVEDINNSFIIGTIFPKVNVTLDGTVTFYFCVVTRSYLANELLAENKLLGNVTYSFTAYGNYTFNFTTEALTEGVVSSDVDAQDVPLVAYKCLDDGSEDKNTPVAYQQGSTLSVCLRSSQLSPVLLTGVDMVISPFSSGFAPVLIVDDNVPVKPALTLVLPLVDQTIIQIKTVLISLFFLDDQNKVSLQGSARFIYNTRKERILRFTQGDDDVGSSTFELVVNLGPNESGIFDVSSQSSANFLSMFIMPLLLLIFLLL